MPVPARMEPQVDRHGSLGDANPADSLGREGEGLLEAAACERIRLALERGDEQLVGLPTGKGAEQDQPVALLDDANPLPPLLEEDPTEQAAFVG